VPVPKGLMHVPNRLAIIPLEVFDPIVPAENLHALSLHVDRKTKARGPRKRNSE
jgi:hypothetical protein